jgi:plastocyanin
MVGCGSPAPEEVSPAPEPVAQAPAEPGVIEIKAEDFAFTAPPTFPSGWVKLRFDNQGAETHFVMILELPEGVTFDDYVVGVGNPFNDLYKLYRAGELDQGAFFGQLTEAVPEWIFTARRAGGPGFTAPGGQSETMIFLTPGDYIIECYVRTMAEGDTFHNHQGMLRPLIVTAEDSGMTSPDSDVDITLSNYTLTVEGDLTAGSHVARVEVQENPESLVFHNVHLVKLDDDTSVETVAGWMNWVDEMLPPAPARFLGGAGQASAGGEASYLSFDLEPGRYAWISEMHGIQGMVHEFTVE